MLIGPYAVDGFFALTGFLLSYPLLSKHKPKSDDTAAHKKDDDHSNGNGSTNTKSSNGNGHVASTPSFDVRDWYYRRITRMVPFYLIILFYYWYLPTNVFFNMQIRCLVTIVVSD
jgi:peptidoglycan/LPS O-acetylase OafA/YrhL